LTIPQCVPLSALGNAPTLRVVIDDYIKGSGIDITPDHEVSSLSMGISLVVSTEGIALLPLYAQNFLPPPVTSRPIKGEAPTIDLVLGYHKENKSPLLKLFLSRWTIWSTAGRKRATERSDRGRRRARARADALREARLAPAGAARYSLGKRAQAEETR
jgi:hypothetical protein